MKKKIKQKLLVFLAIIIILTSIPAITVSAAPKVGDPLGDVLYSDITAYINGNAIPTSVIKGKTLVAVEDLSNYGFNVVWNGKDRSLKVELNTNKKITPLPTERNIRPVGTVKTKYLYTDITTYLSGQLVESYAVNGVTLIDFELLAKYGNLSWDGNKRELKLTIASTQPQPQSIKYYWDHPSIPDFGSVTGAILDYSEPYSYKVYYGYDENKINAYYGILKNHGFTYWFTSDSGMLSFYKKGIITISVHQFIFGENKTFVYIDYDSYENTPIIKYYKDYPSIPDFGAFSGAKLTYSDYQNEYTSFFYNIYSDNTVQKYYDLLIENGFKYRFTGTTGIVYYEKGNYVISASVTSYNETHIFIAYLPAYETSTNNNTSSTSSKIAFPLHIYSNDGKTYLGKCITDKYASDGIYNTYGKYGSSYELKSIFNKYGDYGSQYSNTSAFNERATEPPKIVDNNGKFIAYLTINPKITPRMNFIELDRLIRDNGQ